MKKKGRDIPDGDAVDKEEKEAGEGGVGGLGVGCLSELHLLCSFPLAWHGMAWVDGWMDGWMDGWTGGIYLIFFPSSVL